MKRDWKEVRLKDVTALNPSITKELDELVSFVPMENLRNGFINNSNTIQFQEAKGKYTYFSNGDLLLAKVTPCFENGNIAIAENLLNENGFGSSEIFVLRTFKNVSNVFLFYYCQSIPFREEAISTMSGVAGLKRIPSLFMRVHSFCLPPLTTQHAIANYLDEKLAVIDRNISLLEQKRERYTALRKSLINKTVRYGLNPDAEMKDSGIEWLGEIPKHWEVKRMKDIGLSYFTGFTPEVDTFFASNGDTTWVTIADIQNKIVDSSAIDILAETANKKGQPITPKGSLLFSFKLSIGKVAFAGKDLYTNEAIVSILPTKKISLNYLYYILPLVLFNNATENIYGAKMLNQKIINNMLFAFPPLSEQVTIAEYLDKQSGKIDRIVENINAQLDKLTHLKKCLINECVTGEREVKNQPAG